MIKDERRPDALTTSRQDGNREDTRNGGNTTAAIIQHRTAVRRV